ncbi:translation elongation factor 4 [Candidatus Shikimatogenerans silvanidophilus]|uniref:translation elongation factor 4 n=1 Tax=Candidatus Shikimatogenerans silvanidophilus TaxID=2782547 RepID=UPI001BAA0A9B|nr:translation elongation factor 4 [Candidatus Shikimatogenerans silvanidophilus]
MKNIRNFCIIAHIDHGKSTLADCILEETKSINKIKINQLLDDMDIERERGITIKSRAVQMNYIYKGEKYILNLIDTPGHVDFYYEVYKSISSCEGALLVIDVTKGIQSQTISNLLIALDKKLTIIPILNKIDLLDKKYYESIIDDVIKLIKCSKEDIIFSSAKKKIGIKKILEEIILKIPSPNGEKKKPFQAIIFDSVYNKYRGIEFLFRVINGSIKENQKVKLFSTNKIIKVEEVGKLFLKRQKKKIIKTGDIGYLISGIKNTDDIKIGDFIVDTSINKINYEYLFKKIQHMVFSGIYPYDTKDYEKLKSSIKKLKLNDFSFLFKPEASSVLGFGFRCGFLGMLHMEIIKERLEREYNLSLISTIPNVSYKVFFKKNKLYKLINNPYEFPEYYLIKKIEEPYVKLFIVTFSQFIGKIINLCIEKRGKIKNQKFLTLNRVELIFYIPLSEIIFDFYDKLKTISKGYASLRYIFKEYKVCNLKKITIIVNNKKVDTLSILTNKKNSIKLSKIICKNLLKLIPKQQFDINIQASIDNKIISRETIKSLRKNVTSKCYGGDISRKRKLLEKQKKGKKKMKLFGKVEIPKSAFLNILNIDKNK